MGIYDDAIHAGHNGCGGGGSGVDDDDNDDYGDVYLAVMNQMMVRKMTMDK
ncbi:hypothetical protein DPMN_031932 [Dreissena polymorpha]|uniref:Uncharacterized protein n=1 Tax=Dreissena polymorpha TaxID=45954 RepID=A0A9D4M3Q3_DREPO|nr:hypothetical protein DPMN_031932 [Dreissena polymorpha]